MKFIGLKGREIKITNASDYIIDWNGKSRSKIQEKVKTALIPIWKGMVVYEEFPVVGTKLTLDFYNRTSDIAIEVQGKQHTQYIPFFHGESKLVFADQLKRDREKRDFCANNGIKLVQIFEKENNLITTEFILKLINGHTRN